LAGAIGIGVSARIMGICDGVWVCDGTVVEVGMGVWVCDGIGVEVGTGVFDGCILVLVGAGSMVGVCVAMILSSSPTMKRVIDTRQQVLVRSRIIRIGTIYWLL
jgi:hypothetical protein